MEAIWKLMQNRSYALMSMESPLCFFMFPMNNIESVFFVDGISLSMYAGIPEYTTLIFFLHPSFSMILFLLKFDTVNISLESLMALL